MRSPSWDAFRSLRTNDDGIEIECGMHVYVKSQNATGFVDTVYAGGRLLIEWDDEDSEFPLYWTEAKDLEVLTETV